MATIAELCRAGHDRVRLTAWHPGAHLRLAVREHDGVRTHGPWATLVDPPGEAAIRAAEPGWVAPPVPLWLGPEDGWEPYAPDDEEAAGGGAGGG